MAMHPSPLSSASSGNKHKGSSPLHLLIDNVDEGAEADGIAVMVEPNVERGLGGGDGAFTQAGPEADGREEEPDWLEALNKQFEAEVEARRYVVIRLIEFQCSSTVNFHCSPLGIWSVFLKLPLPLSQGAQTAD